MFATGNKNLTALLTFRLTFLGGGCHGSHTAPGRQLVTRRTPQVPWNKFAFFIVEAIAT